MIKKLISTTLGLACMISILAQKDNPDCADKDYDLFTNLEGFFIERCEAAEFKTMEFWVERGSRKVTKDGKYTKLWYKQSPQSTRSIVGKQIVANYANAVKKAKGELAKTLKEAHDQVEPDEDEHIYHTKGWSRELWIESLGMKAVLPPPEEVKKVETAIGAARAEQSRSQMLR